MVTLLLIIIYLAFIGLGLPDALLGSAWSVMKNDIHATTEMAGYISLIISFSTVVSSLSASRLLHRFGTGKVTLFSILSTTIALLGFSFSENFVFLLILAVPLGLGAGSVDAALSNYVALHFKAKHMNWLHCFWGIGAVTGPLVMAYWLNQANNWRAGYVTVGLILLGIVVILLSTLSLWKIFEKGRVEGSGDEKKRVSNREAIRIPGVKMSMLAMLCYNGSETAAGLWMASFFIVSKGVSPGTAAALSSLFFIGIILGRIISGFLSTHVSSKNLIRYGGIIGCFGLVILVMPIPYWIAAGALFIVGLGGAPIYPSIVHATPERFGEKASPSVIGLEMASAYTGSTLIPLGMGLIASEWGMSMVPLILLILFSVMFAATELVNRSTKATRLTV
ncbi:MFS transporter [Paenibacillus sp. PK1-4R]|uniref:MFS transporter n=1 Tax=Paenibacillus sp. PK1-4R TaxID=3049075 RepID=UPI0025A19E62|nr:MFS transporter [Paenibacillus sp. PK1-4R]WJM11012.1 MFS transporter [Paenibacillus sp. PK1-4R]